MALPEIKVADEAEESQLPEKELHEFFQGRLGESIQALTPELRNLSEPDLMYKLNPTPVDYALRRKFWESVNQAKQLEKERIYVRLLYEGICTQKYYLENVITNPLRVAWITRPPVNHQDFYEAINRLALEKIIEYIKTNKISEKNFAQILKITEMSANRAYGAVAQKMQIQSKNLNVEVKSHGGDLPPPPDQSQLSQQIESLQARLLASSKDVTPKE